ncbi:MAG: hypothetical protein GXO43_05075 [Crenarchaeota archaeon]|nr:hypothetical protein [Thermoproteota archaeon]
MESLSPIIKWFNRLNYEVVEKGFHSAKIIVFVEGFDPENIIIRAKDKYIYVYASDDNGETYSMTCRLWFRITKIKKTIKNGILTLELKGARLFWII